MRHRVLLTWTPLTLLTVVLLLVACGGGDEEAAPVPAEPAPAEPAPEPVPEPAPEPAAAEPAAGEFITVDLREFNDSGQPGTATLTPTAEGVDAVAEVSPPELGIPQIAWIAGGTCAELGEPYAIVEGLQVDGTFARETLSHVETDMPLTQEELQAGEYVVLVTKENEADPDPPWDPAFEPGLVGGYRDREGNLVRLRVEACGDIPRS